MKARIEILEKVQAPCHGCCFAAGLGLVILLT